MAEWLRPRVFIAENGLNIRRISVGSKSCTSKKSIGWAVGAKVTSRRYYGRRKPILLGVRMAEWLRPGLWEVLTIMLRGIEPGQILIRQKPTGKGWY